MHYIPVEPFIARGCAAVPSFGDCRMFTQENRKTVTSAHAGDQCKSANDFWPRSLLFGTRAA
jgi:hypothetical protein